LEQVDQVGRLQATALMAGHHHSEVRSSALVDLRAKQLPQAMAAVFKAAQ